MRGRELASSERAVRGTMPGNALPVLIGVGQYTNRSDDLSSAMEPVDMMARAARLAAEDAGAPRLLSQVDCVAVINILSWPYADPAGLLAERIGAHPVEKLYTSIGGNGPQWMVNEMAERIANGRARLVLIAGAEAFHSVRIARRQGAALNWTQPGGGGVPVVGETRWGNSPIEQSHRAQMPSQIYPLFENSLRAHRGWSVQEHRRFLGQFCAAFSRVASDNPHAWFRNARTPEEIATLSPENRMIAFPYTKYMNAILEVDQAAALLLTGTDAAVEFGVPRDRWVYVWGSGDANDHWFVSNRVNYFTSPAIRRAGEEAMRQAGIDVEQIDFFDLYSCFPCAPQIAAQMLGVPLDEPSRLTVTGGLPYAGGPGNNYCSHAIAAMVCRLRAEPGRIGLVSGVGWYLTKHSVGIYSAAPPPAPKPRVPPSQYQTELDRLPHPNCVAEASGAGEIEAYTVLHDRDGNPDIAVIVGRLRDGTRFWANTRPDRALLEAMEREEFVGRRGTVRHDPAAGVNLFEPGE